MSRKLVLVIALTFVLMGILGVDHTCAQRTVGVREGQWAEYKSTYSGNGTIGQRADRTRINIQKISGTNITWQELYYYPLVDSPFHTSVVYTDVESGAGNGSLMFIAANLKKGDILRNTALPPFYVSHPINDTIFRQYLGVNMEVNYLHTHYVDTPSWGESVTTFDWYWNRATGMLTEVCVKQVDKPIVGSATWFEGRAQVVATTIPEFPSFLVLPLSMIATLLIVIVYRRKFHTTLVNS